MRKLNNFLFPVLTLLFMGLLFSACEKEANVKLPETEPKPVLVCFLCPEDSFITVRLTNSIPLYSGTTEAFPYEIRNAKVRLSHAGKSIEIPWFKDSVGYRVSSKLFPVIPGETYQLDVSIPDGRTLVANTVVPLNNFPETTLKLETQLTDSNEFLVMYDYSYELSWTDFSGEGDYYRTLLTSLFVDTIISSDTSAQILQELFESDKGKDATLFQIIGKGTFSYTPGTPSPFGNGVNLAYLILANSDYYNYHKDLSEISSDMPFSEPKINFSNVKGGIGCFGAYRIKRKRF